MRNNPKLRKALTLILCAVALVAISVGATLAYLTDNDSVKNTFTVGHVDIDLYETDPVTGEKVTENEYHLLPGQTYKKDPTITIKKGSEDCYIAAKIVVSGVAEGCPLIMPNDFLGIEGVVTGGVFEGQNYTFIAPCTWESDAIKLTQDKDDDNYVFMVYYKTVQEKIEADSDEDAIELTIFDKITIPSTWDNDDIQTLKDLKIEVTAYAMQAAGFEGIGEGNGVEAAYAACDGNWENYDHPTTVTP